MGGGGMGQSFIWAKWACAAKQSMAFRALSHKQGVQFHLHLEQSVFLNHKPWTGGEHGSEHVYMCGTNIEKLKEVSFYKHSFLYAGYPNFL